MADPIRVIVVEDEELMRELLATALSGWDAVEVVSAYGTGEEALLRLDADRPDVALLDIDLGPGETGVHIGLRMRQWRSDVGIVLLSNYDEPGVLTALPRSEAFGWAYLLKKSVSRVATIIRAIEGTRDRLVVVDPQLVHAMRPREHGRIASLTPRQRDILRLIAEGYSNAGIAAELVISAKSVENYVTQVYQGLGIDAAESFVHARVKATLMFLEESGG